MPYHDGKAKERFVGIPYQKSGYSNIHTHNNKQETDKFALLQFFALKSIQLIDPGVCLPDMYACSLYACSLYVSRKNYYQFT